jgi:hypothetical protein
MDTIPALSPLTTSSQPNASIIFHDEAFPIFKEIFTVYSRKAADHDHLLHSQFVITSPVTPESVQIFIDICQEKSSAFDDSQILELLSLCEEWSVDSLKVRLLTLIENDDDHILTCLRYAIENGFETDQYEARARRRFSEIVDKDELLELPIPVLRRIVDVGLQDTDFDKLFVFLRKCLNRFGVGGSVLFEGVNPCHFSVSQLDELKARRDFAWSYLSAGVCDTISLCLSEMSRHRLQFEEEHRSLCEVQREYGRIISESEAARQTHNSERDSARSARVEFDSRLSSLEASAARFESLLGTRLGLVESNYVSKSELESNYPKKSELESSYATKSELQADYVTKSDANSLEQRCASKASVEEELNFLKRVTGGFPPIAGSPLKGIIHHLTLECGGNVADRGIVSITADRPINGSPGNAAKNIADLEANSHFYCDEAENMWVCYDFKNMKVILTDYSIRSRYNGASYNLKSWVIEVSNTGADWTEVDRQKNRDDLCAQNVVRSFAVSKPSTGRYVRLRQIGLNNHGCLQTIICGFELFGSLTW